MKKIILSSVIILALSPTILSAAGYYSMNSTPTAAGRGGAYAAGPDTPYAVAYNPAGLAQCHGLQFAVACDTVFTFIDYSIAYNGGIKKEFTAADISNVDALDAGYYANKPQEAKSFTVDPIPTLLVSYGFENVTAGGVNLGDITLLTGGFWYTRRPNKDYDKGGKLQYTGSLIETSSFSLAAPAVAWKFCDYVSVGGTFELIYYGTKLNRKVSAYKPGIAALVGDNDPFSNNWNIYTEIVVNTFPIPCWNAGLMITPTDSLSIGAMYHHSYNVNAEGTFTIKDEGFFDKNHPLNALAADDEKPFLSISGDKIQWITDVAGLFRSGIKYKFTERFDLEFNFGIEFWNVHKTIQVKYNDIVIETNSKVPLGKIIDGFTPDDPKKNPGTGTVTLDDIMVEKNFQNSYSYSLGSDIKIIPNFWTFRLGALYETGAVPEDMMDSLGNDQNIMSGAIGSTFTFSGFDVSFACQYNHVPEKTAPENSNVTVTNILDSEAAMSPGTATIAIDQINLSLGAEVKM